MWRANSFSLSVREKGCCSQESAQAETHLQKPYFFSKSTGGDLVFSATPSWFNIFCFPWWLSASCHMNYKDTDGYPKHGNSIFPLLLIFPKMSKPLWLALSLLRQFLSTAIPFSLSNDSRESTVTRSCSVIQTNRPTLMHQGLPAQSLPPVPSSATGTQTMLACLA